jgi:hypothetical protein
MIVSESVALSSRVIEGVSDGGTRTSYGVAQKLGLTSAAEASYTRLWHTRCQNRDMGLPSYDL